MTFQQMDDLTGPGILEFWSWELDNASIGGGPLITWSPALYPEANTIHCPKD
jgi:hypothetical protein